jgi:hypothetical protein
MLASAHYATRKGLNRPFARATARDRRMGQKLSMGLTPAQVARLEGLAAAEVETLVAESDFAALVDGYRALHATSEGEQRRILTQLARHLLMEATALGDVRVATFVILQERMGKDPARTLADRVIAASQCEPRPAPLPALRTASAAPRPAYPSDDPDLRAMQRVEDRLCAELAHEHAVVHAAVAADEPAADAGPEAAAESGADDPKPVDAPVEAAQERTGWRTRRRPQPGPSTLPSYEQARAIHTLLLLRNAAPTSRRHLVAKRHRRIVDPCSSRLTYRGFPPAGADRRHARISAC